MELLLGGCTAEGFIAPIPVGTQLLSCTVTGGTVSVDMSSEYDQLIGIDRTIADYCITLSLMQLDGIYAVRLTVAGELPADRTSEVYTSEEVLLTSPDDVVRTVKVQLYFPDGGGTLVGEERRLTVYEGETVAQAVVKALTERPLDSYADLYPLLPEGFTALNASTEEGICYLNLPGSVAALLPEDAEAQNRMIQGLVDSLCSLEDVTQVQLMLDGEYQLMLGSVPISRPILPTGGVQPWRNNRKQPDFCTKSPAVFAIFSQKRSIPSLHIVSKTAKWYKEGVIMCRQGSILPFNVSAG